MHLFKVNNSVALTILPTKHYLVPEYFHYCPKKSSHSPIPFFSLIPGNEHSTFLLCGFAYSGHLILMESCNTWSFGSGFFLLV